MITDITPKAAKRGRKTKEKSERSVSCNLSLYPNMLEMATNEANRRGCSLSELARTAIKAELLRSYQARLEAIDPSNYLFEGPTDPPPGNPLIHELPATGKTRAKKGVSAS